MILAEYRSGATRSVLLLHRWAIKFPSVTHGYRAFLHGLLANHREREFSRMGWSRLCPVVGALPLGVVIVMPWCEPVAEYGADWWRDFLGGESFPDRANLEDMVERKADSIGKYRGRIVAVDYGG